MLASPLHSIRDVRLSPWLRDVASSWTFFLVLLPLLGCDRRVVPSNQSVPPAQTVPKIASVDNDPWPPATRPIVHQPPQTPREPRPDDWFVEASVTSGVSFTYRNGREGEKFTLLESVGGGAAIVDFDIDELPDLFITGGGTITGSPIIIEGLPSVLYRNNGGMSFQEIGNPAGLTTTTHDYSLGCSVCDYNCDGHPDIFVTGYPRCRIYCNHGDGTFQDATDPALLNHEGLHAASTWGDFDGDGFPDLFVTGYVTFDLREDRNCGEDLRRIRDICGIWQYPSAPDHLYRNCGNGTFEDTTISAGLRADGKGLGAVTADIDDNGTLDIYVANDYMPNFLYLGDGHGKFAEHGLLSGVALDATGSPQGSMGVDFSDYNGDGHGDLFVTNYQLEDNILYRNLGDASFAVAAHVGLQDICRPYVGFGTGWVDWDSDGWLDLFVLNGHVMYHTGQSPYEQPQFLFHNLGGKRFENRSELGGPYFSVPHVARGGAVGDLNNDGAPDLVVVHQNSPVTILKNKLTPARWVCVCLRGTKSDPFAVGAVLTTNFAGRDVVRHVRGGAGYMSHFDRRILLPVDGELPTECVIRWLNGRREMFRHLKPGRTHQLIEGRGESI